MTSGKQPSHVSREGTDSQVRRESEPSPPLVHRAPASPIHQTPQYTSPSAQPQGQARLERVDTGHRQQGIPGNEPVTHAPVFTEAGAPPEREQQQGQASPQLPSLPSNISAPNLTTYIHHIRMYSSERLLWHKQRIEIESVSNER